MKSVMLSIKPKYCDLIVLGLKTVELRKTKPKIETPFKCYIYCTKKFYRKGDGYFQGKYCGKVIGNFVCDAIFPMSIKYSDPESRVALKHFPFTCLTDKQIMDYLGNGKQGYGWHISDLVIYDEPKEMSEFYTYCSEYERIYITAKCEKCKYYQVNDVDKCAECTCHGIKPITRPPQFWCYVEG